VRDERGAVFAEYVVVLLLVSLLVAIAVGTIGLPLFNLYLYTEILIGLPIP
jgi:Flp pilus assembly pilin Flp